MAGGHLRRALGPPARRPDVRGVRLDAGPLVRGARWPAHAADPPLGRADLPGRDVAAHAAHLLHRRVPQAPRDQLGDRLPAAHPRRRRRLHRLLAPGRPAVGHRSAHHRGRRAGHPGRRHLRCRSSSSAASSPATTSSPACSGAHPAGAGLILALVALHLFFVVLQKHTQYPGSGRTDKNVVGYPFFPIYVAKAGGFFFTVFGVIVAHGGDHADQPGLAYGPYDPSLVSAGAQPDWYIGFLDGALRMMPNWETQSVGFTLSLNVLIPSAIMPSACPAARCTLRSSSSGSPATSASTTSSTGRATARTRPRSALRSSPSTSCSDRRRQRLHRHELPDVGELDHLVRADSGDRPPPVMFWVTKRICLGLQRRGSGEGASRSRVRHDHGESGGRVLGSGTQLVPREEASS